MIFINEVRSWEMRWEMKGVKKRELVKNKEKKKHKYGSQWNV